MILFVDKSKLFNNFISNINTTGRSERLFKAGSSSPSDSPLIQTKSGFWSEVNTVFGPKFFLCLNLPLYLY